MSAAPEKLIVVGKVVGFCVCGQTPCSGLDCGVYGPGGAPRKKVAPKPAEEMAEIRSKAWATRRAKYGVRGHR